MPTPSTNPVLIKGEDIRVELENHIISLLENYVDNDGKSIADYGYQVSLAPNDKRSLFISSPVGVIFANYAGEVTAEQTIEMSFNVTVFSRFLRNTAGAVGVMSILTMIKSAMQNSYNMRFKALGQDESFEPDYYCYRLEYFTSIGE